MIRQISVFILLYIIFLASPWQCKAQSADVRQRQVTWVSSESVDLQTGNTYRKRIEFVTHADQQIDIPNRMVGEIKVSKVEGTWPDLRLPGKLVYYVVINGQPGTVTVEKNDAGTFFTIDTTTSTTTGVKRKFTIDSTQVAP